MAPSCVPANALETNGADFGPSEMRRALRKDTLFGLGEVMDVPSVLACDPEMMEKLSMFQRIDGHAPGVTGKSLNAYRLAGIATDHECSTFEQGAGAGGAGFLCPDPAGDGSPESGRHRQRHRKGEAPHGSVSVLHRR